MRFFTFPIHIYLYMHSYILLILFHICMCIRLVANPLGRMMEKVEQKNIYIHTYMHMHIISIYTYGIVDTRSLRREKERRKGREKKRLIIILLLYRRIHIYIMHTSKIYMIKNFNIDNNNIALRYDYDKAVGKKKTASV